MRGISTFLKTGEVRRKPGSAGQSNQGSAREPPQPGSGEGSPYGSPRPVSRRPQSYAYNDSSSQSRTDPNNHTYNSMESGGIQGNGGARDERGDSVNQDGRPKINSPCYSDDGDTLPDSVSKPRVRFAATATEVQTEFCALQSPVGGREEHADGPQDAYSDDDDAYAKTTNSVMGTGTTAVGARSTATSRRTRGGRIIPGDSVSQARTHLSDTASTVAPGGPIFVQKTLAPYRPVPGDAAPISTPAVKYVFETSTMTWTSQDIFLRILHPNRGYDQDDLHVYFAVEQVLPSRICMPMVAKMFRRIVDEVREDDYFGEAECQALAEGFCHQFNRFKPRPGESKPALPLLTCRTVVRIVEDNIPLDQLQLKTGFFSYRTFDTGEVIFMMEPNTVECAQSGVSFAEEMKLTSYPPLFTNKSVIKELAEAFSHFSYTHSGEQLLVTGLQRYAGYLVDPLVYTADRRGYGIPNTGNRGIVTWRDRHICNPFCRVIGLRPLDDTTTALPSNDGPASPPRRAVPSGGAGNYYVSLSDRIIDYRDACVPKKELAMDARPPTPPRTANEPLVRKKKKSKAQKAAQEAADKAAVTAPVSEPPPEVPMILPVSQRVDPVAPPPITVAPASPVMPPKKKSPVASPAAILASSMVSPLGSSRDGSGPATLKGYKYVFVQETQRWFPVDVTVVVANPDKPIAKERYSKVFAVTQVVGDALSTPMYARVLNKEGVLDVDYFNLMDAYIICSTLANSFNEYKKEDIFKKFIHFMERTVVRIPYNTIAYDNWSRQFFRNPSQDSKDVLFVLEPIDYKRTFDRLVEEYNSERTKVHYVDSDDDYGHHDAANTESPEMAESRAVNDTIEWHQVMETFYHFCYVRTGRNICVNDAKPATMVVPNEEGNLVEDADLTFTGDCSLVDPCLHTYDGVGFERMNEGNSAVLKWVHAHRCNALCSLLALPGVSSTAPLSMAAIAGNSASKKDPFKVATLPRNVSMHFIYSATKYTFDYKTLRWVPSPIFIRIVDPERGFAMGAMRVVFEVTECSSGLSQFETPLLAKLFRHNIADVVEKDYFNEGALQNLCYEFGKKFSEVAEGCAALAPRGDTTHLEFMPVSVVTMARENLPDELFTKRKGFFSYKTKDSQKLLFTVEEKIEGTFTKYNSNGSAMYANSETRLSPQEARRRTHILEAAEALSHYSLTETKGALLICDIQGVGTKLTDPEIHTFNGVGLGIGNRGREGMVDFVSRHRCNFVCKSLQLPSLNMRVPEIKDPEANEWAVKLQQLQNMPINEPLTGKAHSPAN